MAATTATVKIARTDSNNVEITFTDTDEAVAAFCDAVTALDLKGFSLRVLTPRNPYGSKGMPVEDKIARLQAQLAELSA